MATDQRVAQRKYDEEIKNFRRMESVYRERGIWLISADFPRVIIAFATPKSPNVFVPFAAEIDFTDYDAEPLSVVLVHPVTLKRLKMSEVLPQFSMGMAGRMIRLRTLNNGQVVTDQILQAFDDSRPFLCIAGVREYHDNPAHTGDSWWLHRRAGEGTLSHIVNLIWAYGVKNIIAPQMNLQVQFAGFSLQPEVEPPVAATS